MVAPGGVITNSNSSVRDLLGLNGDKPNLEMIALEIQPSESLFALCAQEGKARFNIGEKLFEGRSYSIPHESGEAMLISFRGLEVEQRAIRKPKETISPPLEAEDINLDPTRDGSNGHEKTPIINQESSWMLTQELEKRVQERTAQLRNEHRRTEALLRITTELSTSLDFECILQRTLEVLNEVIGASHATCMVLQSGSKRLRHVATVGYQNPLPPGGMPSALNINQGLVGWIISNRQPVLIDDVLKDDRWMQLPNSWYSHRSAIGAPIIIGDQLLGVLLLYYPEVGRFSEEQLDLIRAAANQMAVAIKNAELYHLTRDQKEELSTLLRDQRVETSRSRSILEAIADGVLVTDQHGEITLFNHSAERMLELKRAEVIGRSIEHFSGLFGGIALAWMNTINSWIQDHGSFHPMNTFSEQVSLDNGNVLSVNLAPVINNNEFFGTVSIFRDITHLIEVDRLKSEFVATVSHELRTPMTSIKGYVDILLMGVAGELSDQQLRFLRVVQENTERLTILVNDLLDLSRIEAGQVILSMGSIDLSDLIEEVMEEIDRLTIAENKSMQFALDLPPDLPLIKGDAERIRQILINLLGNAFHYTPSNGNVSLSARQTGEEIQVDIKDNGVGIPPKEQERIFDRFYRGENHMVIATAGTGLGLSIVAKLINMHNGRIWVQSSGIEGEGSIFSFTLPLFTTARKAIKVR
ncbi:MAG: GAF domain-containing protein [Chloroflexota bacterium]|nr:MAG: GAF domain-containing protein [Chloroflexota bacterium]